MTIIKPTSLQDIAIKEQLQEITKKAGLTLSEVNALNKQFGTKLEYVPQSDVVEITSYIGRKIKGNVDPFDQACSKEAFDIGSGIVHNFIKVNNSIKNSFEGNLSEALKKIKTYL